MSKNWMPLIGAGLAFFLVACGSSEKHDLGPASASEQQGTKAGDSESDMMKDCPMQMMKDLTLTMTDTPTGITVDFITSKTEKVDMVRTAVKHMAEMHSAANPGDNTGGNGEGTGGGHNGHHGPGNVSPKDMGNGTGGMMGGDHGGMMGDGGCKMNMMDDMFQSAVLQAQDIEGGARLIFTAQAPGTPEALRAGVRSHFDAMQGGKCPMMK